MLIGVLLAVAAMPVSSKQQKKNTAGEQSEDMQKSVFKEIWKTIKNKQTWHGVIKNRHKDGGYYVVDAYIIPLLDRKNDIIEYLEPKTKKYYTAFVRCRDCGKIYWEGSHFSQLKSFVSRYRKCCSNMQMVKTCPK